MKKKMTKEEDIQEFLELRIRMYGSGTKTAQEPDFPVFFFQYLILKRPKTFRHIFSKPTPDLF